jgi:hypothetical protein
MLANNSPYVLSSFFVSLRLRGKKKKPNNATTAQSHQEKIKKKTTAFPKESFG